jgi:hypothetical protein
MSPDREFKRDLLFNYAVDHPTFTVDDLRRDLGWSYGQTRTALHDLRLFLGEFDDVALPCNPTGTRERWEYGLVGGLDGAREWIHNRTGDAESRIQTVLASLNALVQKVDGRTVDGRRIVTMHRQLTRLVEDLSEIAP